MLSTGDFVFPPHLSTVSALPGQTRKPENSAFQMLCFAGLQEFGHWLPDFFNTAGMQLIFMMQYDSINLVL